MLNTARFVALPRLVLCSRLRSVPTTGLQHKATSAHYSTMSTDHVKVEPRADNILRYFFGEGYRSAKPSSFDTARAKWWWTSSKATDQVGVRPL